MTTEEFINIYWSQYILLEKEFLQTLFYLSLDPANDDAYSHAYSKLMLEIGSEVDVIFKEYCKSTEPSFNKKYRTMDRYRECMIQNQPDFVSQRIGVINYEKELQPWADWIGKPSTSHDWWIAYNSIKHNRTGKEKINNVEKECYKFANQKFTLHALAGLYQIMIYFYKYLADKEGKKIVTPLPGSRLFELKGGDWDEISFFGDSAFYIDDNGHMIWETGKIYY